MAYIPSFGIALQVQMLLLQITWWLPLLELSTGQNINIPAIPTFNVNSALDVASSATAAGNAAAQSATQDTVPSATSAALAEASSATQRANSIASAATQNSDSTTATSGSTHATTTTSTSSSSTSPTAASSTKSPAESSAVSTALSSSSKVGIGLGVPLGVALAAAAMGFLLYRHKRYKRDSRLAHHGNIRGGADYSSSDEENKATTVGSWDQRTLDSPQHETVPRDSGLIDGGGSTRVGIPEVHGEHIPPYSTELGGSSGAWRHELP